MALSNCTIPHSGHGYVLEMTDEPGALTYTSPVGVVGVGLGIFLVAVGSGCALVTVKAFCVSVLKKSLALRPGTAALVLCFGRNQLVQLKEPDKQTTSKRSEIFRSFFIVYLLISFGKTTEKDRPEDSQSSPSLFLSLGIIFVNFKCYIGT